MTAPRIALWLVFVTLATSTVNLATAQPRDASQEGAADIVAVQLRQQGHRCDKPVSAEGDAALSRPDERAWVVKCANASYRMRLMPGMAAVVEPLN
jgi:hypothetical protein